MKFNSRERKKIIAEYIECGNYSAVARKYKVTANAIKKIVTSDKESSQKFKHKKEQNDVEILQHMDGQKYKVCLLIDKYLMALNDDEKIKSSTLVQITTSLGTLIDKFTMVGKGGAKNPSGGGASSQATIIAHIDTQMSDEEIEKILGGLEDEEKQSDKEDEGGS